MYSHCERVESNSSKSERQAKRFDARARLCKAPLAMPKGKRAAVHPEESKPEPAPPITAPPTEAASEKPEPSADQRGFPDTEALPRNGQEKLNIYIAEGKLDTAPMRTKSQDRLKLALQESLRDPAFKKWVGIAEEPQAPRPELVSPFVMRGVWDTVANIEAMVYAKKTGLSYQQVKPFVAWNEGELNYLSNSSAQLANKYIPPEWLKYADVYMFLAAMGTMMKVKADTLALHLEKLRSSGQAPPAPEPKKPEEQKSPVGQSLEAVPMPTHGAVSAIGISG